MSFLPALAAGIVILLVGWLLARLAAGVTRRLLVRLSFDRRLANLGLARGEGHKAAETTASVAFWLVILLAATQAARAMGLNTIAAGLVGVIAFLPHLLAALLIVAGSVVLGNWLRDRIVQGTRTSPAATTTLVGGAVKAGVLTFGGFMALRELGIAESIVTIAFTLTLGAIAVATALAFGLGSRKTAEQVTSDWYERARARHNGSRAVEVHTTAQEPGPGPGPIPNMPAAR